MVKSILTSHDNCLDINAKAGKDYYPGYSIATKAVVLGRILEKIKGIKTGDPAIENLDLSKLSNEKYRGIIEEACKIL